MMESIDRSCLDEATILELIQGRLERSRMSVAEGHIARCAECRTLVSTLARSSLVYAFGTTPSGSTEPLPPSMRPSKPFGLAPQAGGASLAPPPPVREGDIVAGKYRVERVLGVGGMGLVVAATHVHLGQRVALKFLLPAACQAPGAVARFLREGRAAVRIQSEHVARVTDVGILDGNGGSASDAVPYMIMEFLHGTDLAAVLRARGPLPIDDAIDFVLQACEAVAEAHALGIVHRDLKPANLFLTSRADGSPLVKVLDFGISKASHTGTIGSHTTGELVMGSPRYMSPEQMRSTRDVDARTDVWALGVLLHELLTGHPVFDADTMAGLCALIATATPVPLRAVRPNAPEALEAAILRCLEKDPRHRMQSVAALAEALAPIAPARARVSVERIVRVLRGLGNARTELDVRAHGPVSIQAGGTPSSGRPASFPPIGAATGGGFGRTAPTASRALGIGIGSGVLAVLLVVGAIAATIFLKPAHAPAPASASPMQPASIVAEAPSAPPPPPPAVAAPTLAVTAATTAATATAADKGAPAPVPPQIAAAAPARAKPAAPRKAEAAPPTVLATPVPPAAPEPEAADVRRKGLLDRK